MTGTTQRRTLLSGLLFVLVGTFLAGACVPDNEGEIWVWSENKGSYVYGDEFVAPGTRFRLEFRESCSAIEYCTEDPVSIVGVSVDGPPSSVSYQPNPELEEAGSVVFDAGSSGRASVEIDYENAGRAGSERMSFEVRDPNAIVLKRCEGSHLLETHPRVDLIEGYTHGGERMLAAGYAGREAPYAPGFSPQDAVTLSDDDYFFDTFRVEQAGALDVSAPIDIALGAPVASGGATPLDPRSYTYDVAPIDAVERLDTDYDISDTHDGEALSIAVDVVTDRPMCVEPAFFVRVLTPDVCHLWRGHAKLVDDPTAFWTLEDQFNPHELSLFSIRSGTCRVALSVPGRSAPEARSEIEVELNHR